MSVVVPTRDEETTLQPLLDGLLAQTVIPDEIIVADGDSTDRTVEIARAYQARGVRVLVLGPAYPGRGRNLGIEAARTDWVALIDAGCRPDSLWLEKLLEARERLGGAVGAVYGSYDPWIRSEWDVAQALTIVAPRDRGSGNRPPFIASCLVHRRAWEAVGGFPADLRAAEDLVFFRRLAAAGIPTIHAPGARVQWELAPTVGAFFRRLRLYSAHHLAAGLWRTWHARVFAMDLAACALAAGMLVRPESGLLLAVAALGRVGRTVATRRTNVRRGSAFRPDRLLRVGFLLVVADTATWLGTLDHLVTRARG